MCRPQSPYKNAEDFLPAVRLKASVDGRRTRANDTQTHQACRSAHFDVRKLQSVVQVSVV